jgi:HK97 family phage portal protein/HK97 family phage prohead protease
MLQSLLKGRKPPADTVRYELVNASNSSFIPFSGNTYENDIARSAVWTIAEAAGKASFLHVRGEGADMRANPDPMIRLMLEQPNEFMTMQDFIEKMVTHLELHNNAFALIARGPSGRATALYPLDYATVELREAVKTHDLYCRFRFRGARTLEVPYGDIIHLRKHFNADDFFGDGNKAALYNLMEIINTTDQGMVNAVRNSAVISWLLKFKQTLKPEDIKKQIQEFSESYLKTAANGWGAAPTDPRYDAEQVKQDSYVPNAPQMDKSKQRLYAYFGVNDAIVQKTYNEDQWNAWFEGKIEPILMQFARQMTMKMFTMKERAFRNRIVPQSTAMAYASMTTKLGLVAMVDRGSLTPNEWRETMNLPPIEGGDAPLRRLDTQAIPAEKKPADGPPNSQPIANLKEEPQPDPKPDDPKEGKEPMEDNEQRAQKPTVPRHDWAFEIRSAEAPQDGTETRRSIVEGRAVTFETPVVMYECDGIKYYEVIRRGALDNADMSDVPMRYNHSESYMIVARHNAARPNRSNLDLTVDDSGLLIRADLARTESGRQLYEAIEAGLIEKMSFAFTVAEESYDQATHTRSILKIQKLWDVSAVDTPAYDSTSIFARNRFQAEAESEKKAAEAAERRKRQLALELETTLAIYGGVKL